MNKTGMGRLQTRPKHPSNANSLLMASFGLIFFAVISTVPVYAETISVDIDGTSYDIEYTATGMTVSGVESDTDFISLTFRVDVTESPGTLEVTFERSFFDSLFDGGDDDFIILADGDEPNFTETETNAQSRTLSIDLPAGTEEVDIVGSVFGSAPVEEPPEEPVEEPPEEPVVEPVVEPVEEPPEEPVVEPVVEPVETPTVAEPTTQCDAGMILVDGECVLDDRCGTGTILVDGECVLDDRCGTGTILVDGVCVLVEPTQSTSGTQTVKGMSKELVIGVITAFIVAGTVGVVLGIMSKASKNRD